MSDAPGAKFANPSMILATYPLLKNPTDNDFNNLAEMVYLPVGNYEIVIRGATLGLILLSGFCARLRRIAPGAIKIEVRVGVSMSGVMRLEQNSQKYK